MRQRERRGGGDGNTVAFLHTRGPRDGHASAPVTSPALAAVTSLLPSNALRAPLRHSTLHTLAIALERPTTDRPPSAARAHPRPHIPVESLALCRGSGLRSACIWRDVPLVTRCPQTSAAVCACVRQHCRPLAPALGCASSPDREPKVPASVTSTFSYRIAARQLGGCALQQYNLRAEWVTYRQAPGPESRLESRSAHGRRDARAGTGRPSTSSLHSPWAYDEHRVGSTVKTPGTESRSPPYTAHARTWLAICCAGPPTGPAVTSARRLLHPRGGKWLGPGAGQDAETAAVHTGPAPSHARAAQDRASAAAGAARAGEVPRSACGSLRTACAAPARACQSGMPTGPVRAEAAWLAGLRSARERRVVRSCPFSEGR
ncbi:hypothetical protein AcV5_009398 [Taiwanofungus camphoratus]|nr:hypothetical protein AcV5_009398 [Antrodia cinnamomea]